MEKTISYKLSLNIRGIKKCLSLPNTVSLATWLRKLRKKDSSRRKNLSSILNKLSKDTKLFSRAKSYIEI